MLKFEFEVWERYPVKLAPHWKDNGQEIKKQMVLRKLASRLSAVLLEAFAKVSWKMHRANDPYAPIPPDKVAYWMQRSFNIPLRKNRSC